MIINFHPKEIESKKGVEVIAKINQANLKSLSFPKYPKDMVIEFNKITKPYLTKIHHNKAQTRTLEKLRDTLLPKLMSGEVRVSY